MEYKKAHLVDRLKINLTEEQEMRLNHWLDEKKRSMEEDREQFLSRHQKYLFNWDDFVTFNRKGPWEGSCFLPGTDLLTKRGWIPVEQITECDLVFSRNPKSGELDYIPVEVVWNFEKSNYGVRFYNSRGLDITVTENHRMYLLDERSGAYPNRHCFKEARELLDGGNKKLKHWGIPRNGRYNQGTIPLVPDGVDEGDWFELWGWYLSEGSSSSANETQIEIAQSITANPEKYERIKNLLSDLPFKYHAGDNGHYFRISLPHELREKFKAVGRQEVRFIPRELLQATPELLKRMFEAMLLGDGSQNGRHWSYATSSYQLACDVQELLVKIGLWGSLYKTKTELGKDFYIVSVRLNDRTTFQEVKVEKVNYIGPSYCVTTEWGVVYARMNGHPLFIGQSNLHMPLTSIMVKSYHSRLYNIFSHEDTTQLIPREETDETYVEIAKKLRTWYLWDYINGYKGIRGFTREVTFDAVTTGFGLGMKDWLSQQRKTIVIEPNELKREMADLGPQMQELNKPELETDEEMEKRVDVKPYKEVSKIITVYDGSRVRSVPFENAYFPNDIPESNDLDHPPCIVIESEISASELLLRSKQQEWSSERAKKVIDEGFKHYNDTRAQNVKEQRGDLSGYNDTNSTYDTEKRVIQYCFCTYDIDDDGIDEEVVVTRSESGAILKINWLDRISRLGLRPLIKFDCFSKPRQAYSRGVPEFMYPLNEEMDEQHNMRMNALALQTCPFGTYRSSSSLKNQPIRISPGKFIPVDEVNDLKAFNFQVNATVLAGEEDRLWHYAERQTSVSSLSQGIVPSTVGPTRSTSGVIALLQQMDKEFKVVIDQCASQWKKLEKMLMDDLDFRIDASVKMRVLGASVEDFIDPTDQNAMNVVNEALRINAAFDMKIDVANVISSDEIRRNEASIILNKVSAPSVAHQFGVLTPKTLYKAWTDYLKAFGKEVDQYLDKPVFTTKPLTLYQEVQICGQGEMPPMSMQDDHMGKAEMLRNYVMEPEYIQAKQSGVFVSNVDDYMLLAMKKHLVLAQMMQPKGLPNPSGDNGQDMNEVLAGQAPQQEENYGPTGGGEDRSRTESTQKPPGMEEPRPTQAEAT